MIYEVIVAPTAERDLAAHVRFIASRHLEPESAKEWLDGALMVVAGLSEFPRSHPVIPEQSDFDFELRHAIYHSHRIIFEIDEDKGTVHVLRVHHGAQSTLALL